MLSYCLRCREPRVSKIKNKKIMLSSRCSLQSAIPKNQDLLNNKRPVDC